MAEDRTVTSGSPRWCLPAVVLAAVVGLGLLADTARSISATYDEVAYLRVASAWWRTGRQSEITRMGSPLTFWKAQQVPALWLLDRLGRRDLVDDPIGRQSELLPLVRLGGLWVWLLAFAVTVGWSRRLYGPRAMAISAWLFALGPNLLAHGSLVTMETPLVAGMTAALFLFWLYLRGSGRRAFWASAVVSGLTFSCKFTAVTVPPLLALVWWLDLWRADRRRPLRAAWRVTRSMIGFTAVMLLADWALTGFAVMPLSRTAGGAHPSFEGGIAANRPSVARLINAAVETPIPQDWVGFATQLHHQRSGGPSYLFGERRMTGWWYYYFVALAVKVPLTFWLVVATRAAVVRRGETGNSDRGWVLPTMTAAFLVVTAVGSSRNYGLRYLLPLAPLVIVWVSALAERSGWPRGIAWVGIAGQALAVVSIHPNELTYFNAVAGGRAGGRKVLADSNLDWGQGLRSLARLQRERPEYRDLTFYYFGETNPRHYGVVGACHVVDAVNPLPGRFEARTRYVAVSESLRAGPWGPPGYFQKLGGVRPVRLTDDTTIAIYRTADVFPPDDIERDRKSLIRR